MWKFSLFFGGMRRQDYLLSRFTDLYMDSPLHKSFFRLDKKWMIKFSALICIHLNFIENMSKLCCVNLLIDIFVFYSGMFMYLIE